LPSVVYVLLIISFALNILLGILVILLRDEVKEYQATTLSNEEIELLKRRLEKIKR